MRRLFQCPWHRLSACALCFLLFACSSTTPHPTLERHQFSRVIMGVQARIVVYADSGDTAFAGAQAAFNRLDELDAILSDYRPSSELRRLCAAAPNTPHTISPDLYAVLRTSLDIAQATNGAFDPTLGPLTKLWREARRTNTLPTPNAIAAARARTGFRNIRLRPPSPREGAGGWAGESHDPLRISSSPAATLLLPGMLLDLGGVAKGYAAAQARDTLRDQHLPICLVALAGDIALGDPPPSEPGWRIALTNAHALLLSNASISTSGSTEQFLEIGNVRYSHLLNPATGLGVTHALSVTVVGQDGAAVDALSSALSVLAPATPEGVRPILRPGMAAVLFDPTRTLPGQPVGGSPGEPLSIDPENLLRWVRAASIEAPAAPEALE